MAGGPLSTKESLEMSTGEELGLGGYRQSHRQSHEQLVAPAGRDLESRGTVSVPRASSEILEQGTRSLGLSQRRLKSDSKASGSAATPPAWGATVGHCKKPGSQQQMPRMSREGHGDTQEYPGNVQGVRYHYECDVDADLLAEIGLEELNNLEMEVMRRQMQVINGRLRALEDQGANVRHRDVLFFTVLVSACLAKLWLWMRQ